MIVSEKFRVGFKQTNENFEMTNSAMLNYFVDVAGIHSAMCGELIETSPTRWLVLGYKMRIFKRPKLRTYIIVSTWSSEIRGITALREFEIRDEDGELMVICLSNWVSVNIETRKMERLTEERMGAYESEPERTNFDNKEFEKMFIPESFDVKVEFVADWKLMDINRHMNNANYLEVVEEFAPLDFKEIVQQYNFDINYKKEILCGQKVLCCYKKTEEGCVVFLINKETNDIHSTIKYFK